MIDFILKAEHGEAAFYIPIRINNACCLMGVFLKVLPYEVGKAIIDYIFANFKVKKVQYTNSVFPYGFGICIKQRILLLPDNEESLMTRLSKKHRYNINRSKRLFAEKYDDFCLNSLYISNDESSYAEAEKYTNYFLKLKEKQKGYQLCDSGNKYICDHNIDFISYMIADEKIIAVLLAACQGGIVNFVNTVYDDAYEKLSPGILIYVHFLQKMILMKKEGIYMGGDKQEYKKHFDSFSVCLYSGTCYRNNFKNDMARSIELLKQKLRRYLHK